MARRRLALTVGINDYPGTGADLKGCVNDALDWSTLLRGEGYDVTTLLNAGATWADVVTELEGMVAEARFGDRIVFTYSGHGSWVPDRDGDEPDRRDEVLVLHDYADGGLLADDELHAIFAKRRVGVRVTVISDSCHSGTLHRFAGAPVVGSPRFLPPAVFLPDEDLERAAVAEHATGRGASRPSTILMSGCSDAEFSYDAFIGGRFRGAFTAAALDAYRHGSSLRDWHARIRRVLPSNTYPQSPQLAATAYQRRGSL